MKEKIGIVFAGGGSRGSFHHGVLDVLVPKYDICAVTGTSIGALMALATATKQTNITRELWLNSPMESYIKHQIFKLPYNVYKHKSILDGKILDTMIDKVLLNVDMLINSSIKFSCTYTDLYTGKQIEVDNRKINSNILKQAIKASCSIAGVFPPVEIGDTYGIDGGYKEPVPLKSLTDMGLELDRIFIILCYNKDFEDRTSNNSILSITKRSLEILIDQEMVINDLNKITNKYLTDKMTIIQPDSDFKILDVLDFDQSKLTALYKHGKEIASKHV